jgi:hypothetical protein
MPVGMGEKMDMFNLYQTELRKNDMLYVFTDGVADQFGGEKGKKFKYKQLTEKLQNIAFQSVQEQNERLQSIFENFLRIKTGIGITNAVELFEFRTQMTDFSPAYLYPRYSEFALHNGVDKYFRDIGVITTNSAPECGYQVGISDCKKEPYFNPYRIIR